MKEIRQLMGMPVIIEVIDPQVTSADIEEVFSYLTYIDTTFSTYKEDSEISQINAELITPAAWSQDMQLVMNECERTKKETQGFFDIQHGKELDPSGYVKGWAIDQAAKILSDKGFTNFSIEIAGDLQVSGLSSHKRPWVIGIRNPFNRDEIIKRVMLKNKGIATSGTAVRGQHIYNPHNPNQPLTEIVSLTVIGPRIVDADRYATAAFAMGRAGINFIAELPGFEGYMIDAAGIATFTPGFSTYTLSS